MLYEKGCKIVHRINNITTFTKYSVSLFSFSTNFNSTSVFSCLQLILVSVHKFLFRKCDLLTSSSCYVWLANGTIFPLTGKKNVTTISFSRSTTIFSPNKKIVFFWGTLREFQNNFNCSSTYIFTNHFINILIMGQTYLFHLCDPFSVFYVNLYSAPPFVSMMA